MEEIAQRIIDTLSPLTAGRTIETAVLGLRYTAVQLDDGSAGIAFNFLDADYRKSVFYAGSNSPAGKPAVEILKLLASHNTFDRSLALSAANALAAKIPRNFSLGDTLDSIDVRLSDTIVTIGDFTPMRERLTASCRKLTIIELDPAADSGMAPYSQAGKIIPSADILLVTAASIVNGTVDDILQMTRNCREVIILGATTPFLPEVFIDTPVTGLSGVKILDSAAVLSIAAAGGGSRRFKSAVQKVNLRI